MHTIFSKTKNSNLVGLSSLNHPNTTSYNSMYAIAFDLDTNSLQKNYTGTSWNNAYLEIRKILQSHGFTWQQGSVYFGDEKVNPVTCVLAVMDCSKKLPWFSTDVRDIRMLRIEELNDLMPAIHAASNP